MIRRVAESSASASAASAAPSIVGQALVGSGRPLEASTRADMEGRFGRDFGDVRIHDDHGAAKSAAAIDALAYTAGSHIVFGRGHYAPQTDAGRRLLAHELAHVAQQYAASGYAELLTARRQPTPPPGEPRDNGAPAPAPAPTPATPATTPEPAPTGPQGAAAFVPLYKGKTLSTDPKAMRAMLDGIAAEGGLSAAEEFASELANPPANSHEPFVGFMLAGGGFSDTAQAIISTVQTQYSALASDWNKFLGTFDDAATTQTRFILQQSETRVKAEQLRYGVTSKRDRIPGFTPFADPAAKKGLADAAGELVAKRRVLDDLVTQQASLTKEELIDPEAGTTMTVVPKENQAKFNSVGRQIEAARVAVDQVRALKEGDFPILAAYAPEGRANTAALAAIAANPETGAGASSLAQVIDDRLDNIAEVMSALDDGRVDVWKSPVVVGGTKRQLGVAPGSWQDRAVEDRRKEGKPLALEDALITAVAIGIGLIAAIPTAGASVEVAAAVAGAELATVAISAYGVASAVQDYQLEKAQTGTDFDKARAISQEDPSLLWVAISIVGLALDLKDAARIFSEVGPIIRRALTAETAEAFKQGLEELAKEPAAKRVPGLIDQVEARYGSAEGIAEREKATAARTLQKEVLVEAESMVLAEAVGGSGHTIKVTKSGWLVRCSECATLRLYYAQELVGSPEFVGKLRAAEDLAAKAAAAEKAGEKEEAKRLAEQSRQLADALTEDMDKARRARLIEQPRLGTSRAGVRLTLDPAELSNALKQVESDLSKLGLEPDAITRILQKSPNVDHMRGQLVEEVHADAVKKALTTPKGREALLGKGAPGGLEFIDGHRIRNRDGRLITDGVVGVLDRDKGTLHIVAISEAKAGQDAAEGLTKRLTRLTEADRAELRKVAAEDIVKMNAKRAKQGLGPVDFTLDDYIKELQREYVQGEAGGQPLSVLERMTEVVDDKAEALPHELVVDGERVRVEMKSPRFLIATPSDVDVKTVPATLKGEGITAALTPVTMTEGQVSAVFEPVIALVDEAEKAAQAP